MCSNEDPAQTKKDERGNTEGYIPGKKRREKRKRTQTHLLCFNTCSKPFYKMTWSPIWKIMPVGADHWGKVYSKGKKFPQFFLLSQLISRSGERKNANTGCLPGTQTGLGPVSQGKHLPTLRWTLVHSFLKRRS